MVDPIPPCTIQAIQIPALLDTTPDPDPLKSGSVTPLTIVIAFWDMHSAVLLG